MIEHSLQKIAELQDLFLNYLDSDKELGEINENNIDLQNIFQFLSQEGIMDNKNDLKIFLCMIVVNSNNHFRKKHFYSKIDLLINSLKKQIQEFSNEEIFEIFQSNNRILLYLLENNLLHIEYEMNKILIKRYNSYHYLHKYLNKNVEGSTKYQEIKINAEYQKEGENDDNIAKIIREDKINDFISEIETQKLSYISDIPESFYDTNDFFKIILFPRLNEYAAFFGSIQIFKYLYLKDVQFHPIIWQCAIHGRNYEIIHIIESEENFTYKYNEKDDVEANLRQAIKCHHNEIANYYYNNFCGDLEIDLQVVEECLISYNMSFLYEYFMHQFLSIFESKREEMIDFLVSNDYASILIQLITEKIEYKPIFFFYIFNEILLHKAIEKKSFRIIEFLLTLNDIDVNEEVEIMNMMFL